MVGPGSPFIATGIFDTGIHVPAYPVSVSDTRRCDALAAAASTLPIQLTNSGTDTYIIPSMYIYIVLLFRNVIIIKLQKPTCVFKVQPPDHITAAASYPKATPPQRAGPRSGAALFYERKYSSRR